MHPAGKKTSSPIYQQNQYLYKKDQHGVLRKYRILISINDQELALNKGSQKKVAQTVLNLINEARLNDKKTDLSQLSVRGRKINYQKRSFQVQKESIRTLAKILSQAAPKKPKIEPPKVVKSKEDQIIDEFDLVEKSEYVETQLKEKPSVDLTQGQRLEGEYIKSKPTPSLLVRLAKVLSKPRQPHSSSEHLLMILDAAEKMKTKNGKLRLDRENNLVVFSPSEVGPAGRKASGQKSQDVLTFIFRQIDLKLREPLSCSKIDIQNAMKILNAISESDWGSQCLKNNAAINKEYNEILTSLSENALNKVNHAHFANLDELINQVNQDESFIDVHDLFNIIREEADKIDASDDAAAKNTFYTKIKDYITTWVQKHSNLSMLTQAPLFNLISNLSERIQENRLDASEIQRVLSTVATQLPSEPKRAEEYVPWNDTCAAIKSGTISSNEYDRFVESVSSDLAILSAYTIAKLKPEEFHATQPSASQHWSHFNQVADLVAYEVLTPIPGHDREKQAIHMVKFFLDVQQNLMLKYQLDPFFSIKEGLEKTAVQRLNLMTSLPRAYRKLYAELNAFAKTVPERMENSDHFSLPYLGYVRQQLNFIDQYHSSMKTVYSKDIQNKNRIAELNRIRASESDWQRQKIEFEPQLPIRTAEHERAEAALKTYLETKHSDKQPPEIQRILSLVKEGKDNDNLPINDVHPDSELVRIHREYTQAKEALKEVREKLERAELRRRNLELEAQLDGLKENATRATEALTAVVIACNPDRADRIESIILSAQSGMDADGSRFATMLNIFDSYDGYSKAQAILEPRKAAWIPKYGDSYNPVTLYPLLYDYLEKAQKRAAAGGNAAPAEVKKAFTAASKALKAEVETQFPGKSPDEISNLMSKTLSKDWKTIDADAQAQNNVDKALRKLTETVNDEYSDVGDTSRIIDKVKAGRDINDRPLDENHRHVKLGRAASAYMKARLALERTIQEIARNKNKLGADPTPEQLVILPIKDYNLDYLNQKAKLTSPIYRAQRTTQYSPYLGTSIRDAIKRNPVDNEKLFLLSYQFLPPAQIRV